MPAIARLPSPVAKAPRRLVQPARGAHEVAHRTRGQQVARRIARVDAEVGRAPDDAARPQPCHHGRVAPLGGACTIEIHTAAVGFGPIWQAVMQDFHQRWQLADTRISINDMGATPAVVSLRLDQAVQTILGMAP